MDNQKAAVLAHPRGGPVQFHPRVMDLADHCIRQGSDGTVVAAFIEERGIDGGWRFVDNTVAVSPAAGLTRNSTPRLPTSVQASANLRMRNLSSTVKCRRGDDLGVRRDDCGWLGRDGFLEGLGSWASPSSAELLQVSYRLLLVSIQDGCFSSASYSN